ncbi:MAG: hypothetical protein AAGA54_12565 [Myxococcota bacterium]
MLAVLSVTSVDGAMHAGVPLEEPRAVSTAGGRTLWAAPHAAFSGPTAPTVDAEQAKAAIAAELGREVEASPSLVWARTPVGLRLTWVAQLPFDAVSMRTDVVRVDATTGHVWRVANLARAASVEVYPQNAVATPQLQTFELTGLEPPEDSLSHSMFDVQSCLEPTFGTFPTTGFPACDLGRFAVPDENGDFLGPEYAPQDGFVTDDAFAEASAYYHAEVFMDWMAGFGVTETFCSDVFDSRMVIVTNYRGEDGEPLDNGFYTGGCGVSIVLGQGSVDDFAYDGDLVHHELGHNIVHLQTPSFIGRARARPEAWTHDADAINEAVADAFTVALTEDSVVADALFARDVESTATCPESLEGQAHNDSLPTSAALWSLIQTWGDDFVPVLLEALTALPQDVSFDEFAEAVSVAAGEQLGADAETMVRATFEARGLFGCQRLLPLAPGPDEWQLVRLEGELGLSPFTPPPLQFAIEVPPNTQEVRFEYAITGLGTQVPVFADYAWRWGEPVAFEYAGADGSSVQATFDGGQQEQPSAGSIILEPPSEEATMLYVAFVNPYADLRTAFATNLRFTEAPVPGETGGADESSTTDDVEGTTSDETSGGDAASTWTGADTSDTEAGAAAPDGDGCSCRGGAEGARWGWLAALFGLISVSRRSPSRGRRGRA